MSDKIVEQRYPSHISFIRLYDHVLFGLLLWLSRCKSTPFSRSIYMAKQRFLPMLTGCDIALHWYGFGRRTQDMLCLGNLAIFRSLHILYRHSTLFFGPQAALVARKMTRERRDSGFRQESGMKVIIRRCTLVDCVPTIEVSFFTMTGRTVEQSNGGTVLRTNTLQPLISLSGYDNLLFEVIQTVPLLLQVLRVAAANPFFRGSQDKPRLGHPRIHRCCASAVTDAER